MVRPLLVLTLALTACSHKLPPRRIPPPTEVPPLPKWYPEAAWTEQSGDSRILVEGKIVFETGSDTILPESKQVLETLLTFLTDHPEITRLRVEGHTDSTAGDEFNLELSAKRALAVCHFLVDRGVPTGRLLAVGFGESRPLGPNGSSVGRGENRRTEFHVAELEGKPFGNGDPTRGGFVLEVLTKEEREAKARPPVVPRLKPKPFKPTGNEIREIEPG